ncbi:helix-turn-helix transcriptional regulator [Lacticaseibacillus absianus]|uniref:helix-turn-helix transcriptional regulator n=1 Tax=Lacticaseibacillus absianus TaxID=2729623 RepID=UPI0015C8285D|nr:helix-turn-helix transcriptional regulator [Lacticaseibacillus absianus]
MAYIYKNIQRFADEQHVSIRQLEMDLSFSNGTVSKWKTDAPIPKLQLVANYLGKSLSQLIYAKPKEAQK